MGSGSGASAGRAGRLVEPAPGLGEIVKVLAFGLVVTMLFFFWFDRFGRGASPGGWSGFVTAPPPGVRGGREERGNAKGQSEHGKRALHENHLQGKFWHGRWGGNTVREY